MSPSYPLALGYCAVLGGARPDDDARYRIAATADGGIWLLRTPRPEPVTALAGNRPGMDTSRRLLGNPRWSHEGSTRPGIHRWPAPRYGALLLLLRGR